MLTTRELSSFFESGPRPLDGGLATTLEGLGADLSGTLWSGRVLLEDPAAIARVHEQFLDAGAAVITTASYQVSREGFAAAGYERGAADRALALSVRVARGAVDASGGRAFVAASVGPYGAILHDGSEYRGKYAIKDAALRDFHAERLDVLAAAEPDFFAVETIPDVREIEQIVAALEDLPAWVCISCCDGRSTSAGQSVEDAVAAATASDSVFAVGVNCVPPRLVPELVERMCDVTDLPIIVYPNGGRSWVNGEWVGDLAGLAPGAIGSWLSAGAQGIGGCCDTSPDDIALIAHMCSTRTA